MNNSAIEWTDMTWNPIRGCSRVSEGCRNCYAQNVAYRFSKPGMPYHGLAQLTNGRPNWTGKVELVESVLDAPLRKRKPQRIFVNSMSDLFHEGLDDGDIFRVFDVMSRAKQHTFQVLTKRPGRMKNFMDQLADTAYGVLPNVWLGVSVEDQAAADERIPLLLQTPAAVRFLSVEPILGPVDIAKFFPAPTICGADKMPKETLAALVKVAHRAASEAGVPLIDWCIVGGESGPGARPMHPEWARSLRDQCQAAGVPFFFKQWGEWANGSDCRRKELCLYRDGRSCKFTKEAIEKEEDRAGKVHRLSGGIVMSKVGKKASGRLLDGREWNEMPVHGSSLVVGR
jgi:protein gp37